MDTDWWKAEAGKLVSMGTSVEVSYRTANANIIARAINGIGMDSGLRRPSDGVRAVFNVSSTHLPSILASGYDNGYHRSPRRTIGDPPPVSTRRVFVDRAIAAAAARPGEHEHIHYGAVDLNGTGMRYYGDICLVLKHAEFPHDEVVLSRNSYDLVRAPIADRIADDAQRAIKEAVSIIGSRNDVACMLACKTLDQQGTDRRLLTVGRISQALLYDEDYFEVVRFKRFEASAIEELRLSSTDVAIELEIAGQLSRGMTPSLEELIWRYRRELARVAAARERIPVRVVMSDGRVRA